MKKFIWYIEERIQQINYRIKGILLSLFLRMNGNKVGKRLRCKQFPFLRCIPKGTLFIGNNVTMGIRITLEARGKIILHDYVSLTQDVFISSNKSVELEDYVACGEYVTIRDTDHQMRKNKLICEQGSVSSPILLKKGCDINHGVTIFRGVTVEEGAVIGINTILMRNFVSVPYGIYMGNPVKMISKRF